MIGLRRYTVHLSEHDSAWATLFEDEARTIRRSGGSLILDIQHVGSTAVLGLPAKPIVDIAIAVDSSDAIHALANCLAGADYIDRGDGGEQGGHLLVRESEPAVRMVHVHIVMKEDPQWLNYITFRDILRQNPDIRTQYAELKGRLAATCANDRKQYTAGKNDFIKGVIARNADAQINP